MNLIFAIIVGGLFAGGFYLILQRNMVQLLIGLSLISHGANLLIFVSGYLSKGGPPIVPKGYNQPLSEIVDPLPQALVLTAIVIGFAVLAFTMILIHRTLREIGESDLDALKDTDS